MRTIKELLEVMLLHKDKITLGLCGLAIKLYDNDIITVEEHIRIDNYIQHNRPSAFSSISALRSRRSNYYWVRGDIKPRIKWLNKHIKLNS